MGAAHGIYPWGSALVRRSLDEKTFWVVVDFFLGWSGEGKRTRQGKYCSVVFAGDTRVQTLRVQDLDQVSFECTGDEKQEQRELRRED